ncbi:unnamed protein product [Gongylonema pulchrum]|uniref:Transcriptional regulator n=1 Tax=Gongylonema pulchrum TaxID=637853 RepID=A0A183EAL5_9BILA|nr:unnamed protein product [Gongylonema pulchrum]
MQESVDLEDPSADSFADPATANAGDTDIEVDDDDASATASDGVEDSGVVYSKIAENSADNEEIRRIPKSGRWWKSVRKER